MKPVVVWTATVEKGLSVSGRGKVKTLSTCVPEAAAGCDPNDPVATQCPQGYICDVVSASRVVRLDVYRRAAKAGRCALGTCASTHAAITMIARTVRSVLTTFARAKCAPRSRLYRRVWDTRYQFDMSEVFGPLGDLGAPLDFLDQAFRGNLEIPIPVIGDVIEAAVADLIAAYVPPWVADLVHGQNSIVHIFQQMQVVGQMEARHRANPLHVRGTEVWDRAVVMLIDRCADGRIRTIRAAPRSTSSWTKIWETSGVLKPMFLPLSVAFTLTVIRSGTCFSTVRSTWIWSVWCATWLISS